MKKFLKWFAGIILVLVIAYAVGPKPDRPDFKTQVITLPASLTDLEKQINESEKSVRGIKPENQARIVWADTAKKEKTKVAILYIHGLLASQGEGAPVHTDLAKKYNANLYLARLPEHGIERGDSSLITLTADKMEASAERDLEIAKKLGDEVIVMGTSTGGTLALFLASKHPEIKALVLYSPCIKLHNPATVLLNKPWGLQIGRIFSGGPVIKDSVLSKEHAQYWYMHYRVEGIVALVNLYSNTMKPEVFSKVKCPVFLGYFFKNEEVQDQTVSVEALLKMFDELGTPSEFKRKIPFPEAGAHVIASPIRSKDWMGVERETDKFLNEIVKL
jgi:pimeloyl-ACP methyl ester carboxylesterase